MYEDLKFLSLRPEILLCPTMVMMTSHCWCYTYVFKKFLELTGLKRSNKNLCARKADTDSLIIFWANGSSGLVTVPAWFGCLDCISDVPLKKVNVDYHRADIHRVLSSDFPNTLYTPFHFAFLPDFYSKYKWYWFWLCWGTKNTWLDKWKTGIRP